MTEFTIMLAKYSYMSEAEIDAHLLEQKALVVYLGRNGAIHVYPLNPTNGTTKL